MRYISAGVVEDGEIATRLTVKTNGGDLAVDATRCDLRARNASASSGEVIGPEAGGASGVVLTGETVGQVDIAPSTGAAPNLQEVVGEALGADRP